MTDSSKESYPMSDTWKISGDVVSTDIGPENSYMNVKLKRQLDEHYATKQAINIWHGPQNPGFTSLIARIKSCEDADWPETYPTTISLAEAGFFYDSNLSTFLVIYLTNIESYISVIYSRLVSVTEWTRSSVCFHCSCCLVDWLPQDRPFHEHGYWFPDCLRTIYKGTFFLSRVFKVLQRTTPHH